MSQMTLRGLPNELTIVVRGLAKKNGESMNMTIQKLIAKAVGLKRYDRRKRDLTKIAGTWTESEEREFKKNTAIFSHIDKDLWK